MIHFLFTLGLCALAQTANTQEWQMDDEILQEESIDVLYLSNGVKAYIQENETPAQSGSFRIVFRMPTHEEFQYAYDGKLDSKAELEQFFSECKIRAVPKSEYRESKSSGFGSDQVDREAPSAIAIIAVGDFPVQEMKDLIQTHFADITLSKADPCPDNHSSIQIGIDENLSKVALRICYPNIPQSIHTYQDLKKAWNLLLLQELFQQRMQQCSLKVDQPWMDPLPCVYYCANGYSLASEEHLENALSYMLWQVESIRNNGFSEDEFFQAKTKTINQLLDLAFHAREPNNTFLASYYADQFLLGDRCLYPQGFFEASATLVQEIQSSDLNAYLATFLMDKNRRIDLVYPMEFHAEMLTKERIEKLIQHVASLSSANSHSRIFDTPIQSVKVEESFPLFSAKADSQEGVDWIHLINNDETATFRLAENVPLALPTYKEDAKSAFYELPLTEKEKRFIKIIISTMAEKNVLQLAFEKRSLEKKGSKITHVHPLRFIGYILSSSELKSHLKTIKKSSFKWDAFVSGFSRRMREELANDNIFRHVEGFAEHIGSTPEHVNPYIRKKDFEGLIKSLL